MAIYGIDGAELQRVYDVIGNELNFAYDIDGEQIFSKQEPYVPELSLLNTMLMSSLNPSITIAPQGFAIYGNYIFQFFTGDDMMRIFDKTTYGLVGSYSATDIKHANTMQFGTVVQDTGFPLLYVSEWGDSGTSESKTIDALKVGLSGYQKISSFTLPSSVGNFPALCFDWSNGAAYSVGYESGTRDSEYMIISYFDVDDFSATTVQYQVPYMGVLNAWSFHDGNLIYYGNSWDSSELLISFIDAVTHEVTQYTIQKTMDEEYEGCDIDSGNLLLSNWVRTNNVLYYRFFSMNLPI